MECSTIITIIKMVPILKTAWKKYQDFIERFKYSDVELIFKLCKELYNLPTKRFPPTSPARVSERLYRYISLRDKVIILLLYDDDNMVFLTINMANKLYWGLPGGNINKNEPVHKAINRLIKKEVCPYFEKSVELLGNMEPIAWIENEFSSNGQSRKHTGLAFMGRVQKMPEAKLDSGSFVFVNQEMNYITRFANKEIVELFQTRLNQIPPQFQVFPCEEIPTGTSYRICYFIHNQFIKRILYIWKKQKKFTKLIKSLVGENVNSIIDVSCGDNSFIFTLGKELNIPTIVENDISWSQLERLRQELLKQNYYRRDVILTNHNVASLPFVDNAFDVSYCKNTLHHMPDRESQRNLLDNIFRVSKKIILVEIEDPKIGRFLLLKISFILHLWFKFFLKDQGSMYLTENAFKTLVNEKFAGKAEIKFDVFRNIMGKHLIATITKK